MDLVTLATFATPLEADMLRNRLEASGIEAFLADDQTVGWLWQLGNALNGVKVQVAESDVPRALELLEELRLEEAEPEPEFSRQWTCPKCRATVGGNMDVCWACGTTVDGIEDPEFRDVEDTGTPIEAEPVSSKAPPGPSWALLIAMCVPLAVFNGLVGIDFLSSQTNPANSAGLLLLVAAVNLIVVVALFQRLYYYRPTSSREVDAADAASRRASLATAGDEDDWDPDALETHVLARRACLAALLGVAFCPPLLNLYSVWLILDHQLWRTRGDGSASRPHGFVPRRQLGRPRVDGISRFYIYSAIVVNAAVGLTYLAVLVVLYVAAFRQW